MKLKAAIITVVIFILLGIEFYFVFTNEVVFLVQFFMIMTTMVMMGLVCFYFSVYL